MSTSSHTLCIDNHSVVYSACEQIRANWEDLATHLSVARPSVLAIEADGKNSADRLRKLLDEWLKRSSPEQPLPSWRGLCNALAHLDRLLSESISAQHQCGCSLCTGRNEEASIIGLVSPLYNEIYQKLKNPVGVAEYLYSKRVFSLHQLEKIRDSPGNEKEALLTSLESAVSLNQYNLRVFGKALMKEEATHSLGESVLENCRKEDFASQSKIKGKILNQESFAKEKMIEKLTAELEIIKKKGKKLEETMMMKDSMIKQMSAELELKNRKEKKLERTVMMKDSMIQKMSAELELKNRKGYQSSLLPEWTHHDLSLVSYGVLPVYRTVKEFNQLKENDQVNDTEPFYTAQGGYKMTLRVYPNGYQFFKGTHLSVRTFLMRGENDETLTFPVCGTFRVQLLNWRENSGHVERIWQFDDVIPESRRQRVTTGEIATDGWGQIEFLSHEELGNSSDKKYIRNDKLCFKIQFEPAQQTTGPPVPSWCDVMYTNSSTPPCTRTLTRYSEYKKTNSKWHSLPFYSSAKGYKLQLNVYANGCGSGIGSHLSLYAFLLKGEYDDKLKWPFNANISVQLLNWSGDNSHKKKSIPHHTAQFEYRTRVTGDRAPGGMGYQFISHFVLESISSDTRYINEDSVCFRIVNVEII